MAGPLLHHPSQARAATESREELAAGGEYVAHASAGGIEESETIGGAALSTVVLKSGLHLTD